MIPEIFERLRNSDRAVSPVIGVILMVAITVILAAVIAAFVLGFGAETEAAPQASIDIDADAGDNSLSIEHNGGDAIDHDNLVLRGPGVNASDNETTLSEEGEFRNGDVLSINDFNDSELVSGSVSLIWESGDDSHQLADTDA